MVKTCKIFFLKKNKTKLNAYYLTFLHHGNYLGYSLLRLCKL